MLPYSEPEYAENRLKETIVRHNNRAVLVQAISADGMASLYEIVTKTKHQCHILELNLDPVPLGYVNYSVDAVYVVRMPMREDWKQGLRDNNMRDHAGTKLLFNHEFIALTIEGTYPTFKQCYNLVKEKKVVSRAFSRNFMINMDFKIIYKGKFSVGEYRHKEEKQFVLHDKFNWLEDVFKMEVLNAVN